jgi:hypothetical protein
VNASPMPQCSTCRIVLSQEWIERIPEANSNELDMLDTAARQARRAFKKGRDTTHGASIPSPGHPVCTPCALHPLLHACQEPPEAQQEFLAGARLRVSFRPPSSVWSRVLGEACLNKARRLLRSRRALCDCRSCQIRFSRALDTIEVHVPASSRNLLEIPLWLRNR